MIIHSTPFSKVYDSFLSKITDDMYMELTREDTYKLLQELLLGAIPKFEFPRINLYDYVLAENGREGYFVYFLSHEEINILATYMVVGWLSQQLASVENTRMKYSGSDFKFTSQANHMSKLLALKKDYENEGFRLQRLYKRRKADANGVMRSTMGTIMEGSKPIVWGETVNEKTLQDLFVQMDELQSDIDNIEEDIDELEQDTEELKDFVEDALSWDDGSEEGSL